MPTVYEVYLDAMKRGADHGVLSADLRLLIARDMGYELPIDTIYHKDDEMTQISLFNAQFARLLNNEPVEYILKEASFLQHKLYVDNRVLIPRMETEELLATFSERIMDYYDPRNYLVAADIGTGSGAIAIALQHFFPNWIIFGSDISKDALEVAEYNAKEYGSRVHFLEGDSLQPYIDANMNLDIIISNPPYIVNREDVQDSVKRFEPDSALYMDKEDSVYLKIFRDHKKVKKGSLLLCFEMGYDIEDYLRELMDRYLEGEQYEFDFLKDLNGMTRFLFVYIQ